METIYEEKVIKRPVKFIAKDGREFHSLLDCANYEKQISINDAIKNIPHFEFDIDDMTDWFYITSESDFISVIQFMFLTGYLHIPIYKYHNELGWYGFSFESNNDSADEVYYTPLKSVTDNYDKFISVINSKGVTK